MKNPFASSLRIVVEGMTPMEIHFERVVSIKTHFGHEAILRQLFKCWYLFDGTWVYLLAIFRTAIIESTLILVLAPATIYSGALLLLMVTATMPVGLCVRLEIEEKNRPNHKIVIYHITKPIQNTTKPIQKIHKIHKNSKI